MSIPPRFFLAIDKVNRGFSWDKTPYKTPLVFRSVTKLSPVMCMRRVCLGWEPDGGQGLGSGVVG